MKPWMAVVIVVVVLAAGLWMMAPSDEPAGGSGGTVSTSNEKIAVISKGDRVEIAGHLESGRFTIVEFTADW